MKLICSAFRGEDKHDDATNTADLIQHLAAQRLKIEMAIGTFEGNNEISLIVRGFTSNTHLEGLAMLVCKLWRQTCTYIGHDGIGYLMYPNGDKIKVGTEVSVLTGVPTPRFARGLAAYTTLLDGSLLCALPSVEQKNAA